MIANRDPFGAALTGESDVDRQALDRLEKILPEVEFDEGTVIEDVIAFLREEGNITIDVNWKALEFANIMSTDPIARLSLRNVKLETVVKLLVENLSDIDVQLGYDVVDGVVRISTVEDLSSNTVTRVL